ncbi:MAG: hypothetical protein PVI26_08940 [Chitinispirillia bacterium]|jgi:hypothetical protein
MEISPAYSPCPIDLSLDLGIKGQKAVSTLKKMAQQIGIIL